WCGRRTPASSPTSAGGTSAATRSRHGRPTYPAPTCPSAATPTSSSRYGTRSTAPPTASAEPLQQPERTLVPRDTVREAGGTHLLPLREVPVVRRTERLRIREPRLPAELEPRLLDGDERIPVRGLVVPFGQRRQPRELQPPQRDLRGLRGDRPQTRARPCMRAERLEILADGSESRRADVQRLTRHLRVETANDGLDEILDGEQLVAVGAVAEDGDAAALADPVEQDLEHAEALGPDECLRTHDHRLQTAAPDLCG